MKVTYNADVCTHAGECVKGAPNVFKVVDGQFVIDTSADSEDCLLYTSPSPRDLSTSRMPSSA